MLGMATARNQFQIDFHRNLRRLQLQLGQQRGDARPRGYFAHFVVDRDLHAATTRAKKSEKRRKFETYTRRAL
jgi:hypothetical protein